MIDFIKFLILQHMTEDLKTIAAYHVPHDVEPTGEIFIVDFPPDKEYGMPYTYSVILLAPQEWVDIQEEKLKLPYGWENWKKVELYE